MIAFSWLKPTQSDSLGLCSSRSAGGAVMIEHASSVYLVHVQAQGVLPLQTYLLFFDGVTFPQRMTADHHGIVKETLVVNDAKWEPGSKVYLSDIRSPRMHALSGTVVFFHERERKERSCEGCALL